MADDCSDVVVPQMVENSVSVVSEETQLAHRQYDIQQQRLDMQRSNVDKVCDTVNTVAMSATAIVGFVADMKTMHERTEQMRMMTDVQLANIAAKFESTRRYMHQSFGERSKALDKHYGVLDKAIETGDREMIIAAMQGISSIVSTSPLKDIEAFTALFNDTSKPLLDF